MNLGVQLPASRRGTLVEISGGTPGVDVTQCFPAY